MTTTTVPNCPVCSKPMVHNAEGLARNPKAPTWKCSDRNCKHQLDKKSGNWVISEYITGIWEDDQSDPKNPTTGQISPHRASSEQMATRREFQKTIDYKADTIRQAQAHKDESMKTLAVNRDAVQITIAEMAQGGAWDKELIKTNIREWKTWLDTNIYSVPF